MAVTETLTGTVTQLGPGSCGGDTHNISVSANTEIAVTLAETIDPAQAISIQVCAGGIDTGSCVINQQRLAVNQTLRGTSVTRGTHNVKPLAHNCVFTGAPLTAPQSYRLVVSYTTG